MNHLFRGNYFSHEFQCKWFPGNLDFTDSLYNTFILEGRTLFEERTIRKKKKTIHCCYIHITSEGCILMWKKVCRLSLKMSLWVVEIKCNALVYSWQEMSLEKNLCISFSLIFLRIVYLVEFVVDLFVTQFINWLSKSFYIKIFRKAAS